MSKVRQTKFFFTEQFIQFTEQFIQLIFKCMKRGRGKSSKKVRTTLEKE